MNSTTENSVETSSITELTSSNESIVSTSFTVTRSTMRTTTYYYEDTTYDECYDMGCIGATIVTIIILVASALLVSLITSVCYCGKTRIIKIKTLTI